MTIYLTLIISVINSDFAIVVIYQWSFVNQLKCSKTDLVERLNNLRQTFPICN